LKRRVSTEGPPNDAPQESRRAQGLESVPGVVNEAVNEEVNDEIKSAAAVKPSVPEIGKSVKKMTNKVYNSISSIRHIVLSGPIRFSADARP
jgi:hypothetical protein